MKSDEAVTLPACNWESLFRIFFITEGLPVPFGSSSKRLRGSAIANSRTPQATIRRLVTHTVRTAAFNSVQFCFFRRRQPCICILPSQWSWTDCGRFYVLQTRSRIYFTIGGSLKMRGKIDEVLNHFCYVVVSSSTMIGRLYPEICFRFHFCFKCVNCNFACCIVWLWYLTTHTEGER